MVTKVFKHDYHTIFRETLFPVVIQSIYLYTIIIRQLKIWSVDLGPGSYTLFKTVAVMLDF